MTEHSTYRMRLDDALDLLADAYRWRLLVALTEHNPQDDGDIQLPLDTTVTDEEVRDLEIEITHTHLPKLERAGVITWDRERREVSKGPQFDELRPLLELMNENADRLPDGWL